MPSIVSESIKRIFDDHSNKILDSNYYPKTPTESLLSRLTAIWMLEDANRKEQAMSYLKKTSCDSCADIDKLIELAVKTTEWNELKLCSTYTNFAGPFVEYQLLLTSNETPSVVHQHALFSIQNDRCSFVRESAPMIRVIGDPILHEPGRLFPRDYTDSQHQELMRQITIAKRILIQTGGGGIAANQCAPIDAPYQFAIVGVFHESIEHMAGLRKRYPNVEFPQAMIMINPVILSVSEKKQHFKHACLSVPSPNRCEVQSPEEMEVRYLDPGQSMKMTTAVLKGTAAVALWHEMNHILEGKTYIDTVLGCLSVTDLTMFNQMVNQELMHRQSNPVIPELSVPPFYFTITINEQGQSVLNTQIFAEILPKMTLETLIGMEKRSHILLQTQADLPQLPGLNRLTGL